eukprot:GSChrysophyteH2.ASY1.ANO1.185.1 assembled CDS
MVIDPACFNNYFISDSVTTSYNIRYCDFAGYRLENCPIDFISTQTISVDLDIPFVYNYTCSPAILRAYVPLYANMYSFLMVKCLVHFVYLYYDAMKEYRNRSNQNNNAKNKVEKKTDNINLLTWDFIKTSYNIRYCELLGYTLKNCPTDYIATPTISVDLDIPFVYNYTCSPAILRAYVPLYANMYSFLMVKCLVHFVYLYYDAMKEYRNRSNQNKRNGFYKIPSQQIYVICLFLNFILCIIILIRAITIFLHFVYLYYDAMKEYRNRSNQNNNAKNKVEKKTDNINLLTWDFIKTIPLSPLVWDNDDRKRLHKEGNVFSSSTKSWIWKTMPNNLGSVLILCTFGILAPALGVMVMTALFAEVYIIELVMGRFLVREISTIIYSKRKAARRIDLQQEVVSLRDCPKLKEQAKEVDMPWGAIAAIKEVEKLCSEIPASIFSSTREVCVIFSSSALSFVLNDIYNSGNNGKVNGSWVSIVMMIVPCLFSFLLWMYFGRRNVK